MADESTGLGLTPTPDTGERLSQVQVWDEATRPIGPAPPAGAVYSRRGRVIGGHLIEVHDHLRAELARVREQRDILKKTLGIFAEPSKNATSESKP